jgi:hypothetical protein
MRDDREGVESQFSAEEKAPRVHRGRFPVENIFPLVVFLGEGPGLVRSQRTQLLTQRPAPIKSTFSSSTKITYNFWIGELVFLAQKPANPFLRRFRQ